MCAAAAAALAGMHARMRATACVCRLAVQQVQAGAHEEKQLRPTRYLSGHLVGPTACSVSFCGSAAGWEKPHQRQPHSNADMLCSLDRACILPAAHCGERKLLQRPLCSLCILLNIGQIHDGIIRTGEGIR